MQSPKKVKMLTVRIQVNFTLPVRVTITSLLLLPCPKALPDISHRVVTFFFGWKMQAPKRKGLTPGRFCFFPRHFHTPQLHRVQVFT